MSVSMLSRHVLTNGPRLSRKSMLCSCLGRKISLRALPSRNVNCKHDSASLINCPQQCTFTGDTAISALAEKLTRTAAKPCLTKYQPNRIGTASFACKRSESKFCFTLNRKAVVLGGYRTLVYCNNPLLTTRGITTATSLLSICDKKTSASFAAAQEPEAIKNRRYFSTTMFSFFRRNRYVVACRDDEMKNGE